MIQHHSDSGVYLVLERIPEVRVLLKSMGEVRADIVELHEVHLQGVELIEYLIADLTGVAVGESGDAAPVFGAVLVVVGSRKLRSGYVAPLRLLERVPECAGEAEARRDSELGGRHVGAGHELPVSGELEVQPLSSVEEVLMVEAQLGRCSEEAGGVRRHLGVQLEAHHVGLSETYVAVDERAVGRRHLDVHAVEHVQGREPVVGRVHDALAVEVAGLYPVEFPEQGFPELEVGGIPDVDLVDAVAADRRIRRGALVPGVAAHAVMQHRAPRQGVGLEEIVVLVEPVVAEVAEMRRAAGRLRLKRLFGKVVAGLHRNREGVGIEVSGEIAFRYVVDHFVDLPPLAGLDKISHLGEPAYRADLRDHLGVVVAEVLQARGHVLDGAADELGVEDDRRGADLLPEAVDSGSAAVRPVVYVQKRVPAERQVAVGLLAQVG